MSDPYAPPGSRRGEEPRRVLPPSQQRPRPPAPPERRPPDPQGAARVARLRLRSTLLVLAGLVVLIALPLPWRVGGIVFLLAGAATGVLALVTAVRSRAGSTPVVLISVGLALTSLLVLLEALNLVFWPAALERQECRETALTQTTLNGCDAAFDESVRSWLPAAPTAP